jgi:hypothetical protein
MKNRAKIFIFLKNIVKWMKNVPKLSSRIRLPGFAPALPAHTLTRANPRLMGLETAKINLKKIRPNSANPPGAS